MNGDADVRVLGYDELAAGSRELARRIDESAGKALGKVADDVAAQTRLRLPRQTGRLAASTRGVVSPEGAIVQMGEGVLYAGYVEYGGRGHPHSPTGNYLYPTALDAFPTAVEAAERVAETEIEGMTWPTPT